MARGKKAAADAGPVDEPWELPAGWRWERLGAVSSAPTSGSPASRFPEKFRYLDVSGIDGSKLAPRVVATAAAPSRARQFVQAGDTVLSGVRVYLRNFALVPDGAVDVASTAFCVIRPGPDLLPRYMHYWIGSDWFINTLLPLQRGNSPPAVLDGDVRDQPVPLPPIGVQRAIVKRVDQLFAEIDEGEAALAEAQAAVETYRKSLLKAAVTGELTSDWRRQNPSSESGADLLRRILAERRARWQADPRNARKKYTEPAGPDSEGLPELPAGWTWATLQQIAFVSGGATVDGKRKPADPVEVPYLRVANVQRGSLNLSVVKSIVIEREQLAELMLKPGDILLNEGGDRDKVGRGWVWEGQLETCAHQNHVFKARPASDLVQSRLVSMYLNELGRRYFLDESKQTTNLASISLSKVSKAVVPIMPQEEAMSILAILSQPPNPSWTRCRHSEKLPPLSANQFWPLPFEGT